MNVISLNGEWNCVLPDGTKLMVSIPGCFDTYTGKKDIADMVAFEKEADIAVNTAKQYCLYFGAVSYYCDIFINGQFAGSHEGMWDNFRLDISGLIQNGKNVIRVEVTKPGYYSTDRFPLRQVLSGFIPDVLCTFGGIWDDVQIEESENLFVDYHYGKGDSQGVFSLTAGIIDAASGSEPVSVCAKVFSKRGEAVFEDNLVIPREQLGSEIVISGKIDDCEPWSIDNPVLYTYEIIIKCGNETITVRKKMGFRKISGNGTRLELNNRSVYLRGVLHWGYYDREIAPNPSAKAIKKEIDDIKAYGFNAIKHCLYIPREKYLYLADENGVFQWIELPLWLPEDSGFLSERIRREYPRLIRQISGHPSVILTSLGCELDAKVDGQILEEMYNLVREKTDTLVKDNSGSGECYNGLAVDYADFFDYHFYGELQNMENLMENFTPGWRNTKPWLFGEFCDSDVMRDLEDVRKAYGVERLMWETADRHSNPICVLKPDFYAHHHDERIVSSGIRDSIDRIKELSVNHSMVHRKITLELTRAFPEIGGYNITSLRDVPLCGDGMFDDMGNPKFDIETFKRSNNDIVLSPAWDLTRIWLSADRVQTRERFNFFSKANYGLHIIMSNYSGSMISNPEVRYTLKKDGNAVIANSIKSDKTFRVGDVLELCYINFTLPEVEKPETFVLEVKAFANGREISNEWPVFVYPDDRKFRGKLGVYDPASIFRSIDKIYDIQEITDESEITGIDAVLTSRLTPSVLRYADTGGKVFLVQRGEGVLPSRYCSFWREGMLYREFESILSPLEYKHWADDLRFFSLSTDTAFDFGRFSELGITVFKPVIRRYDCREWLAHDYMTEISIGKGTIIATTLRLEGGMGKQPMFIKNNVLGRWILDASLAGMTGQ